MIFRTKNSAHIGQFKECFHCLSESIVRVSIGTLFTPFYHNRRAKANRSICVSEYHQARLVSFLFFLRHIIPPGCTDSMDVLIGGLCEHILVPWMSCTKTAHLISKPFEAISILTLTKMRNPIWVFKVHYRTENLIKNLWRKKKNLEHFFKHEQ